MEILRLTGKLLLIILLILIGSKSIYKDDYVVLYGKINLVNGNATSRLDYPAGFTKDNCVVLSLLARKDDATSEYGFGYGYFESASAYVIGAVGHGVRLNDSHIAISIQNPTDGSHGSGNASFTYKVVLMKVNMDISGYELGDINMDGQITEDDLTLLNSYLSGTATLTQEQFLLGDLNSDGKIDAMDTYLLQQKILGNT